MVSTSCLSDDARSSVKCNTMCGYPPGDFVLDDGLGLDFVFNYPSPPEEDKVLPRADPAEFFPPNSGDAEASSLFDFNTLLQIEQEAQPSDCTDPWGYGSTPAFPQTPGPQWCCGLDLTPITDSCNPNVEGGLAQLPSPPHEPQAFPECLGKGTLIPPLPPPPKRIRNKGTVPKFQCEIQRCKKMFKKSNDLKRHRTTVHSRQYKSRGCYTCSCGYANLRKDNYLRHHYGSRRQRSWCNAVAKLVSPETPFKCYCGASDRSASAHLRHVTGCSAGHHGPSGRPRRAQ